MRAPGHQVATEWFTSAGVPDPIVPFVRTTSMTARCDDAVLAAAERLTRDPLTRERLTDALEFVRDAEIHPGTSLRAGDRPRGTADQQASRRSA